MKIKQQIGRILNRSCVFFTVIATVYILMTLLIQGIGENKELLINGIFLLFFYLFSLLLAAANALWSVKAIPTPLRVILHYLICLFGFYTCFTLPMAMASRTIFVGIVLFTLLYALVAGMIALFRSRLQANREQVATYEKQFKKK